MFYLTTSEVLRLCSPIVAKVWGTKTANGCSVLFFSAFSAEGGIFGGSCSKNSLPLLSEDFLFFEGANSSKSKLYKKGTIMNLSSNLMCISSP